MNCELPLPDLNYCPFQCRPWINEINEIFKELHGEFDPGTGTLFMSRPTLNDNVPFDGSIFVRPCANITNWVLPRLTETVNTVSIHHRGNPSHHAWAWVGPFIMWQHRGESAGLSLKDMIAYDGILRGAQHKTVLHFTSWAYKWLWQSSQFVPITCSDLRYDLISQKDREAY